MITEDGGPESFLIEDMMIIKKLKQVVGHFRSGSRVNQCMMSNLVKAQIYSGYAMSVLKKTFGKLTWLKEICHQCTELGIHIQIDHCKPQQFLTEDESIMEFII